MSTFLRKGSTKQSTFLKDIYSFFLVESLIHLNGLCLRFAALKILRYANTIGLVVERLRKSTEYDGLRYFVPGTTKVLYEEYFQCRDLGSELVPVINRFTSILKILIEIDSLPLIAPKQMFLLLEW